ncbi:MAG: hypothetical protein ACYTHJ_14915 [Planctomycetota bacterium]
MDNKQKTLLGVLVVLVLGMGTFWVMSGDSGNNQAAKQSTAPVKKRERQQRVEKKENKRQRSRERVTTRAPVEKRERDTIDNSRKSGKRKRSGRGAKEKKKKIVPAA